MTNDMNRLAEHAGALLAATTDAAGEKIAEARQRLAVALERAREIADDVRAKAVQGARAADRAVHEHPYQAVAIGVGVGALAGYLLGRRGCRRD